MRTLLLALPLLAVGAQPQDPAELESARERWGHMEPGQREAVLERFHAFQGMSPEERSDLRDRAGQLRTVRHHVKERLPLPVRSKLLELSPPERNLILRDHVHQELGVIGRSFREELPQGLRGEFEGAGPERWPTILRKGGRDHREPGLKRALYHLGAELAIDPAEVERVASLPLPEREQIVVEWGRESAVRRAEERRAQTGEYPPGIDAETWEEMLRLPPDEFLLEMRRNTGFGSFVPRRSPRPGLAPGGPGRGQHQQGGPPPRPPGGLESAPRGLVDPFSLDRPSSEELANMLHLRELMRPRLEEKLELRHLPKDRSHKILAGRVRERTLEHIEATGILAAELEELRSLHGDVFLRRLDDLVHRGSRVIFNRGDGRGSRPAGHPDGRNPDGRGPDGRHPDGRGPDGWNPDGRDPDGRNPDGRGPDGRNPGGRGPDGRNPGGRDPGGRDVDGGSLEGRAPGGRQPRDPH